MSIENICTFSSGYWFKETRHPIQRRRPAGGRSLWCHLNFFYMNYMLHMQPIYYRNLQLIWALLWVLVIPAPDVFQINLRHLEQLNHTHVTGEIKISHFRLHSLISPQTEWVNKATCFFPCGEPNYLTADADLTCQPCVIMLSFPRWEFLLYLPLSGVWTGQEAGLTVTRTDPHTQ